MSDRDGTAVMHMLKDHIVRQRPTILLEIIGDDNAARINEMFAGIEYTFISIDEKRRKARVVPSLWDNDHQNFMVCRPEVAHALARRGLVDVDRGSER